MKNFQLLITRCVVAKKEIFMTAVVRKLFPLGNQKYFMESFTRAKLTFPTRMNFVSDVKYTRCECINESFYD